MKGFMNWLEHSFAPKMNKVARNIWVVTVKDSVLQILPFILLGSLFCVGAVLENYISLPFSFWTPFGWTMGMVSLLVSFLIPFNYCEKKRLRKQRLIAGGSGLILFLISITPVVTADAAVGFGHSALGAGGMFCAFVTGIITALVFSAFGKFTFFKEDSAIPDFVRQWFDALLPIAIVVFGGFLIVQVLGVDLYTITISLFMPLQNIVNTPVGFVITCFMSAFIYSMGISCWVLTPATEPIKLANIAANLSLVAAGTATASNMYLYTETAMYACYGWIGGIGCTLPLVILMSFSKSKKLKSLGRASLVPGILNINEPVVFGCIAWNPIMMLAMWLNGIIIPALTWIFTKVIHFAPIPPIQFDMWYCPYPINTWIATKGSIMGVLFVLICFVVSGAIWYPFFKMHEKDCLAEEAAALEEAAK